MTFKSQAQACQSDTKAHYAWLARSKDRTPADETGDVYDFWHTLWEGLHARFIHQHPGPLFVQLAHKRDIM